MYRVSAQDVEERMINVHYYYYYLCFLLRVCVSVLIKLCVWYVRVSVFV